MKDAESLDTLIADLKEAVDAGLAYLADSRVREPTQIDVWGPREVLAHMVYWHQSSTEGMESVVSGGGPYRIIGSVDEVNAKAIEDASGESNLQIINHILQLQGRLEAAARKMLDPGATVLTRGEGLNDSLAQRLKMMARHWNNHIKELKAMSGASPD